MLLVGIINDFFHRHHHRRVSQAKRWFWSKAGKVEKACGCITWSQFQTLPIHRYRDWNPFPSDWSVKAAGSDGGASLTIRCYTWYRSHERSRQKCGQSSWSAQVQMQAEAIPNVPGASLLGWIERKRIVSASECVCVCIQMQQPRRDCHTCNR